MRFCVAHIRLDTSPVTVGRIKVFREWVGTLPNAERVVPRWLAAVEVESAMIEEWEMLTKDTHVLLRSGTMTPNGNIKWHRT